MHTVRRKIRLDKTRGLLYTIRYINIKLKPFGLFGGFNSVMTKTVMSGTSQRTGVWCELGEGRDNGSLLSIQFPMAVGEHRYMREWLSDKSVGWYHGLYASVPSGTGAFFIERRGI